MLAQGSEYSLELDLALAIDPAQSSYEVLSTKVEIKMRKAVVGLKWPALEASEAPAGPTPPVVIAAAAPATAARPTYPSSSKKAPNWAELEREVKKEEATEAPEGDAALQKVRQQTPQRRAPVAKVAGWLTRPPPQARCGQGSGCLGSQLFQQIYANATEEQRRAMNKSYVCGARARDDGDGRLRLTTRRNRAGQDTAVAAPRCNPGGRPSAPIGKT